MKLQLTHNADINPDSRIYAKDLIIEEDVKIGPNTIIVGDYVHISQGTHIKENCDIRASEIRIGKNSEISRNTKILVAERFIVGNSSRISHSVEIICRDFLAGNMLFLGHGLAVGYGGTYESTSTLHIGNRVALGPHNILNANYPIILEDQVGSGCNLALWTHGYHFGHSVLEGFSVSYGRIHIKENVWLGFQTTILPGVTIGKNSIIAAGSVVTKDLPENCLAAGVPATAKKTLENKSLPYKEQEEVIAKILHKWSTELEWKGMNCKMITTTKSGTFSMIIYNPQNKKNVYVTLCEHNIDSLVSMPYVEAEEFIFVTLTDHFSANLGKDKYTIFEIKSRNIRGVSTIVSEDLRNHFRRHGIQCGEDNLFQSIAPPAFQRLLLKA